MAKSKATVKAPITNHKHVEQTGEIGGKAAATRVRLLDAAAKVLSEKGFNGMRLSDVGDVAGVQAPAIYYHFSSKEELAGEVFISGFLNARVTLERVLSQHRGDDALDRLALAIDAHLRLTVRNSDYTRAASHRMRGDVPTSVLERCRPAEKAYVMLWSRLFADASEQGLIREDLDLRIAQNMLLGALHAISFSWKPTRTPPVDVVVASAQRMLLSGLASEQRSWSSAEATKGPSLSS
ncbi:MAG TPA: TetR/AcrR family transcriptional regulator [Acidimicrobiales bacterium]|jgi:AcrR family transcriptional regulator|nr:TetR/AcrR family transcriptional regulator [Acidimicrobiales bacterium]